MAEIKRPILDNGERPLVGARAAFSVNDEVPIHYFQVRISISIAA